MMWNWIILIVLSPLILSLIVYFCSKGFFRAKIEYLLTLDGINSQTLENDKGDTP